jgi:hypothetical protein
MYRIRHGKNSIDLFSQSKTELPEDLRIEINIEMIIISVKKRLNDSRFGLIDN